MSRTSVRDARTERKKSNAPGFTDRSPVSALTMIGKKVMSTTISTLGIRPNPNQTTNIRAHTMSGMTRTKIAIGRIARSINREWAIRLAIEMATVAPSAKPTAAVCSVVAACPRKNPGSPKSLSSTCVGAGTTYEGTPARRVQASQATASAASARAGGQT